MAGPGALDVEDTNPERGQDNSPVRDPTSQLAQPGARGQLWLDGDRLGSVADQPGELPAVGVDDGPFPAAAPL